MSTIFVVGAGWPLVLLGRVESSIELVVVVLVVRLDVVGWVWWLRWVM